MLATALAAIDRGFRIVLPPDALCSADDTMHDALMAVCRHRFSHQIETISTEQLFDEWK